MFLFNELWPKEPTWLLFQTKYSIHSAFSGTPPFGSGAFWNQKESFSSWSHSLGCSWGVPVPCGVCCFAMLCLTDICAADLNHPKCFQQTLNLLKPVMFSIHLLYAGGGLTGKAEDTNFYFQSQKQKISVISVRWSWNWSWSVATFSSLSKHWNGKNFGKCKAFKASKSSQQQENNCFDAFLLPSRDLVWLRAP